MSKKVKVMMYQVIIVRWSQNYEIKLYYVDKYDKNVKLWDKKAKLRHSKPQVWDKCGNWQRYDELSHNCVKIMI